MRTLDMTGDEFLRAPDQHFRIYMVDINFFE